MASDNAKISKGYSSKQSFARAPKGNRLRAVGARGEPILTSRAIRRGAENRRRTDGRAEEACASCARSLSRRSTLRNHDRPEPGGKAKDIGRRPDSKA